MLPTSFDLIEHLRRQMAFSERTFGPGPRAEAVVDHLRKELVEVAQRPDDLAEWIDVVLLALDGAWRQGFTPEEIVCALADKQTRNEARMWPDWRTSDPTKAIEHVRTEERFHYICGMCGKDCWTSVNVWATKPPTDEPVAPVCSECTARIGAGEVAH